MNESQTKFNKNRNEIPGRKHTHYDIYSDSKDNENSIFGKKTLDSDHIKDCIYGVNMDGSKFFINEMKEKKYAKNIQKPLGKSYQRNYNLPEEINSDNFKFGIQSKVCMK